MPKAPTWSGQWDQLLPWTEGGEGNSASAEVADDVDPDDDIYDADDVAEAQDLEEEDDDRGGGDPPPLTLELPTGPSR